MVTGNEFKLRCIEYECIYVHLLWATHVGACDE